MARKYHLSPEGRASLQRAARRVKPWTYRTAAGRKRAGQNALKHGRFTREAIAQRRRTHARCRAMLMLLNIDLIQQRARLIARGVVVRKPLYAGMSRHVKGGEPARHALAVRRLAAAVEQAQRYGERDAYLASLQHKAERLLNPDRAVEACGFMDGASSTC